MIRKCEYVPTLEMERLILRELNPADADDLQEWFCLKEMYTYWGTSALTFLARRKAERDKTGKELRNCPFRGRDGEHKTTK